jgi:PAS domain S-box-containing protein
MLSIFNLKSFQSFIHILSFIPQGHCYLWKSKLIALHAASDGLTVLAYYAISASLLYFVRQRQDLPFVRLFLLFSVFLAACGTTHWLAIWTLWQPIYWVSGVTKAVTALVSSYTAIQLLTIAPLVLTLRNPQELEVLNQELAQEATERQRAEAILRESEARFRCAFDDAAIGMALVHPDGRWLQVNRALCELVGYSESELLRSTFQAITHPDDLEADLGQVQRLLAGEIQTYQMEKRYLHRSGELVWVLLNVSLVRDKAVPQYFVSQIQNITARKQAEALLRQSEARYRAIVEDQTELICRYGADAKVRYVNEAYCRYFNVDAATITGSSHEPLVYEADREAIAQMVNSLSREHPIATVENRVVVNGEVRWTQWNNRILFDQNGMFLEYQSVGRDITPLKRTEAALRQSEQRFRTLLEAIPQLVWVADPSGAVLHDCSQQWIDFTGEALGGSIQSWMDVIHPNDMQAALAAWTQANLTQTSYEAECRLRQKDGNYIWHLSKAEPLFDEQGQITRWYGTCTDICDRKQAEELREQQLVELQRLNLMKDDFLNTVSHELRTPLTNIKMAIQVLERVLEPHRTAILAVTRNVQIERYLAILHSECDQEIELVNDLLDLQRLNAEVYELDLITIPLFNWLGSLLEAFAERLQNQRQQLEVLIDADFPPIVTDTSVLRRIFSELLNNACKYTPPNETITIRAALCSELHLIQIDVCNSGVEIPVEEQQQIFQPFYRIPRSDFRNQGGTGLGLALVKKLAMRLGGRIQVESVAGQTCFRLELPHCRAAEQPNRRWLSNS